MYEETLMLIRLARRILCRVQEKERGSESATEDRKLLHSILRILFHKLLDKISISDKMKSGTSQEDGGSGSGNFGHAGRPGKIGGSAPTQGHENLLAAIKSGKISKKVNDEKQKKHRLDANAFKKESTKGLHKSLLTVSNKQIRRLIARYSGNGRVIEHNGHFKEVFDHDSVIGVYVSKDGKTHEPTTRGTIHYAKDGVHIVPARPKERKDEYG